MLDWFIELYDPIHGGFHGNVEMRRDPAHRPTNQTTAQVLYLLRDNGLLEDIPDPVRESIIAFVQSNQDPQTGLFWDQHYPQTIAQRRDRQVARVTEWANGLLPVLGAKPCYALAKGEVGELPPYLRSLEAWTTWLESTLGQQPGYGSLDDLSSQTVLLKQLPADKQEAYIQAAVDYVNARQNPQTGLWIGPASQRQEPADGAYKYLLFLRGVVQPMPRADAIRESVRAWWLNNDQLPVDIATFVCNPVALVSRLGSDLSDPTWAESELLWIINWHKRHLQPYQRADGGLSGWLEQFPLWIEGARFGQAKGPQSDMRGAAQSGVARNALYAMSGIPVPPLPNAKGFWDRFAARWPQAVSSPPPPCAQPAASTTSIHDHLEAELARPWQRMFHEPASGEWLDRWSLDGAHATVNLTPAGLEFRAGPEVNNHAHHGVLWTKQSFIGDCRIEVTVTRLDQSHRNACLLFIQATGGRPGFDRDIALWADQRRVPLMRHYFENMDLLAVSFASFEVDNNDPEADYIRARRYVPGEKLGHILPPSDGVEPQRTGLFNTGSPVRLTVIKSGQDLYFRAVNGNEQRVQHWSAKEHDPITEGRIGLRLMYGRALRLQDLTIYTSVPEVAAAD